MNRLLNTLTNTKQNLKNVLFMDKRGGGGRGGGGVGVNPRIFTHMYMLVIWLYLRRENIG